MYIDLSKYQRERYTLRMLQQHTALPIEIHKHTQTGTRDFCERIDFYRKVERKLCPVVSVCNHLLYFTAFVSFWSRNIERISTLEFAKVNGIHDSKANSKAGKNRNNSHARIYEMHRRWICIFVASELVISSGLSSECVQWQNALRRLETLLGYNLRAHCLYQMPVNSWYDNVK